MQYQSLEKRALELSVQALPGEAAEEVIVAGQSRLLDGIADTDASQLQKMRGLLRALEQKDQLLQLLEETGKAPGIRLFIGAENQLEELKDFTVVATSYGLTSGEGQALGTLGVIGPSRMNYSRVINLVDLTAQLVNGVIAKL